MNISTILLLSLCILIAFVSLSESKVHKGKLTFKNGENWVLVDSFYFDKGNNTQMQFSWVVHYADDNANSTNFNYLTIYDDQEGRFSAVWPKRKSMSCEDKVSHANSNEIILDGEWHHQPIREPKNPHRWYIVISNCNGEPRTVNYEFEFINLGGERSKQFGLNEQGLLGQYITWFIFYLLLAFVHIWVMWSLSRAGNLHHIVKLLSISFFLEFTAIMFNLIHFASYSKSGEGTFGLVVLADILDYCSELVFVTLLILLARGWTISNNELTGRKSLFGILGVLFIGYIVMFSWKTAMANNPATTTFLWGTAPGIVLMVIRVLILAYFVFNWLNTMREEGHSQRGSFYRVFGAFSVVWFAYLPLAVIFAAIAIHPWAKEKTVMGMYHFTQWLSFVIMTYLFWPSKISEYFQIGRSDFLVGKGPGNAPYESL